MPAASGAAGPINEVTAQVLEASSTSTSRPTLYIRRCRGDGLDRLGLGVQPDLPGAQPQDPHVGLHVALAVQERRVTALVRFDGVEIVGELALKELGGVRVP